jgi:hypothetical protein
MSEFKQLTGTEGLKKIGSLIEGIPIAMLVTTGVNGSFDSRPMAIHIKNFDGSVWFLTPTSPAKSTRSRTTPTQPSSSPTLPTQSKSPPRVAHTSTRIAPKFTSSGIPCTKHGFLPAKTTRT